MNLRPRRRDDPELNLVPMIDVVLVLLIFFMIATSLRHESELEIRLPEASSGKSLPDSLASLEVSIDAAGHYSIHGIEGRLLDPTTDVALLREGLLKASGGRELPLKISADGQTPHQAVVTVLEVAGQLGLRQVDIATMNVAPTIAPPPSATNSSPTP